MHDHALCVTCPWCIYFYYHFRWVSQVPCWHQSICSRGILKVGFVCGLNVDVSMIMESLTKFDWDLRDLLKKYKESYITFNQTYKWFQHLHFSIENCYPITCQYGQDVGLGCLMWVGSRVYVLPWSLLGCIQICLMVLYTPQLNVLSIYLDP